jgi:hypothetical protein
MPYSTGTVRAPALECLACHAIVLRDIASCIGEEWATLRQAHSARHAAILSPRGADLATPTETRLGW